VEKMQGLCARCKYVILEFKPHLVSFLTVYEAAHAGRPRCPQCNKKLILEYKEKEDIEETT
jgi:hypothetical protein